METGGSIWYIVPMPLNVAAICVHFYQPWWLIGSLAALVPIVLAIHDRHATPAPNAWSVLMRSAAIVLLCAALSGPSVAGSSSSRMDWLVLNDVSDSTRSSTSQLSLDDNLCTVVDFAGSLGSEADRTATFIAPALTFAQIKAPDIAGVVIRTDGHFQDMDWKPSAKSLGSAGAKVFILPIASAQPDAAITGFSAHRDVSDNVQLGVTIASNFHMERVLRVYRQHALLVERQVLLEANQAITILVLDTAGAPNSVQYEASLTPGDAYAENDRAEALVGPAIARTAIVCDDANALALTPGAKSISMTQAPHHAVDYHHYSAVLLHDPNGEALTNSQRTALAEYVRSGGGLVMLGASAGERSDDDPLLGVSALESDRFRRKPLRVIVVLDASGSMTGTLVDDAGQMRSKFDQASEALLAVRPHITDADSLAVVTFNDTAKTVYDSSSGRVDWQGLRQSLTNVGCAGPTYADEGLKHLLKMDDPHGLDTLVILVTDLAVRPMDASALANRLNNANIALAIVTVDDDEESIPEPSVMALAEMMDSALVRAQGYTGLADIFARFIKRHRGSSMIRGKFVSNSALFGVNLSGAPFETWWPSVPASEAQVLARIEPGPIVATKQAGAGRSISIATGDLNFSTNLQSLLRSALRYVTLHEGKYRVEIDSRNDRSPVLRILSKDSMLPDNLHFHIHTAEGIIQAHQTGPGRYLAALPSTQALSGVTVVLDDMVIWRGFYGGLAPREYLRTGPNDEALRELANLTGATIITEAQLPLATTAAREQYADISNALLLGALAIMLVNWMLFRPV